MARLIDADMLKKRLNSNFRLNSNLLIMEKLIDTQPTAYDVDKVVKQLKAKADENNDLWSMRSREYEVLPCGEYYDGKEDGFREAIKIVKGGGVNEIG